MTWLLMLLLLGVVLAMVLWAVFVYIAVRETKADLPTTSFNAALDVELAEPRGPMTILVPIDGSAASVAAVQDVAGCPLPPGSTIALLYAIHSRVPVIPDFPPWAFTVAAAHGENIREQTRRAPALLDAAAAHLRAHQPLATVVANAVEGVPKDVILREAIALKADRIVLGSHGRGRGQGAVLGTTAAAVAAGAPCTVQIARPRRTSSQRLAAADAA
jgi:nucleotide-binding universal stress UspA family protein